MVILLTIEESSDEIMSGFPEYVTLSTNVPSNIFYTLDGTDPDETSEIFVERLYLPTTGLSLTLKAKAISGSDSSSVLELEYHTDQGSLDRTRFAKKEGIAIMRYGREIIDNLSYDEDGEPAQETSVPFEQLDLIASTTNSIGEDISQDSTLDFVNFSDRVIEVAPQEISRANDQYFNPKSMYIIIDGTTQDNINEQVVRIINRPHSTFDSIMSNYSQNIRNPTLNTSNFVRYMIDPKTGQICFYYRDSIDNRWVKSIQKVTGTGLVLTASASPPESFVFRWINDRNQSKIY